VGGGIKNYIFVIPDPYLHIHCATCMGYVDFLGRLHVSISNIKAIFEGKFQSPSKSGPKNGGFGKVGGLKCSFLFLSPQKAHPASFDVLCRGLLCVKFGCVGVSLCSEEPPPPLQKISGSRVNFVSNGDTKSYAET